MADAKQGKISKTETIAGTTTFKTDKKIVKRV